MTVEINSLLSQADKLKVWEKNEKCVKPVLEEFEQSVCVAERVMQGQAVRLESQPRKLEQATPDLISFNSVQVGLNSPCLATGSYQQVEMVTQNVKTDFIQAKAAQINEVIASANTSEFKAPKEAEFRADREVVLQQSANVNLVLANSKESDYKREAIKPEQIESSLLEHHSVDCKQNVSLSSEKSLELAKKPEQSAASKSFETRQSLVVVHETKAREKEGEHKEKKKKKSKAMPRISTHEAVVVSSIEPSQKEDSFDQHKVQVNHARKSIRPQEALEISKVDHFDLESEKREELVQTDVAQQDIPLQTAYQVNEIVLDSNVNKFSVDQAEGKNAQINLLENRIFTSTDQFLLEKEDRFKVLKELDQQANKQLISQEPISIAQTKELENISDFSQVKQEPTHAELSLLDKQVAEINRNHLMEKELDLKIDKLNAKTASTRKLLNKARSVSVERSQPLDKERHFEQEQLDQQNASLDLTMNRASSKTQIQALENEVTYETAKLQLFEASTKLDAQTPIQVGIVLSNEKDGELSVESVARANSEVKQDALHLVAADSLCVQSEFMHSPKTGAYLSCFFANLVLQLINSLSKIRRQECYGLDGFQIVCKYSRKSATK